MALLANAVTPSVPGSDSMLFDRFYMRFRTITLVALQRINRVKEWIRLTKPVYVVVSACLGKNRCCCDRAIAVVPVCDAHMRNTRVFVSRTVELDI